MKQNLIIKRPWCPFCGQKVKRAVDAPDRKMSEFTVGRCSCGAVYSCDPTGHNVGAALVETLVYACGDNSDLAWELLPEDDYLTGRIEDYDEQTHQVVETRNIDGRMVRGVLYFVRLHTEISDIAGRLRRKKDNDIGRVAAERGFQPPPVEPSPGAKGPKKKGEQAAGQGAGRGRCRGRSGGPLS